MHVSTDFASDKDLLDRMMDKGIVVEIWDRVGLATIDLTGMRITISLLQIFCEGKTPPLPPGYFWKVDSL